MATLAADLRVEIVACESALAALLREWLETCSQVCGQTEELRERTVAALEQAEREREECALLLSKSDNGRLAEPQTYNAGNRLWSFKGDADGRD